MSSDLQLDSLLNALRAAGLRVGVSEILRLQQVFASQPGLAVGEVPRERLQSLLRAVLVKSAEDRGTFDRVCDAWIDRAEEALELREARRWPALLYGFWGSPEPSPVRQTENTAPAVFAPLQKRHRWPAWLRQVTMAATLALLSIVVNKDSIPAARLDSRRPAAVVIKTAGPAKPLGSLWLLLFRPEMALAALAWAGAGGLWLALRRRHFLPEPEPALPPAGPSRVFPFPVLPVDAVLLSSRDQEILTWSIGRFVSEEPTRRLDLAMTVRATALAGGLPELRFHRACFSREVWLWLDEDTEDPALPRLASEIEVVLASYGVPVERAVFRGVPHRLVMPSGRVLAPDEIEERRDAALVAVLTDGRRLTRRYTADDQRTRIHALLRSLSHWPHLAFVDASRKGLTAILNRYGIRAIPPEQAVTFLSGVAEPPPSLPPGPLVRTGEAAWAAACALCPAPIDEDTALELRRRLLPAVSPYSLQALFTQAPGPPGRVAFRTADRIRLVRWLHEAEAHPSGRVTPESLLGRALDFLEGVYDRSLLKYTGHGGGAEAHAQRSLRLERALLGLWREPGRYITDLYRLYQPPLREAIGQHCQTLAPADWGGTDLIHLPWTWSERTPVERAMLQDMRLGGGMPPVVLRRPGRGWLGIGILLGLGLGAAGMAVLQWSRSFDRSTAPVVAEPFRDSAR